MDRCAAAFRALLVLPALVSGIACGEKPAEEQGPPHQPGHVFNDDQSGVAFDLPSVWAGRYRLSDSVTIAPKGLVRELTLRFVRADSSVAASPLIVARVFQAADWDAMTQTERDRFGFRVAGDKLHALTFALASENPLPTNSADAFGFDTLMIALNQRPLRAWLRPGAR